MARVVDGGAAISSSRRGSSAAFAIEPFARYCLLNGVDELQFLLSQEDAIAAFEARRS